MPCEPKGKEIVVEIRKNKYIEVRKVKYVVEYLLFFLLLAYSTQEI